MICNLGGRGFFENSFLFSGFGKSSPVGSCIVRTSFSPSFLSLHKRHWGWYMMGVLRGEPLVDGNGGLLRTRSFCALTPVSLCRLPLHCVVSLAENLFDDASSRCDENPSTAYSKLLFQEFPAHRKLIEFYIKGYHVPTTSSNCRYGHCSYRKHRGMFCSC